MFVSKILFQHLLNKSVRFDVFLHAQYRFNITKKISICAVAGCNIYIAFTKCNIL